MREEEVARSLAERIARAGTPRAKDDAARPGNAIAVNGNGNHIHYNMGDNAGRPRQSSMWNRMFGLLFVLCLVVSMALLWRTYQPINRTRASNTFASQQLLPNQRFVDIRQALQELQAAVGARVVMPTTLTLAIRCAWMCR